MRVVITLLVAATLIQSSCEEKKNMAEHQHTNALIEETSPYLLQHAHNPVNWVAWNDEAFQKAMEEDKLVLVSIGYSACHWCHVMEHESFEDEAVAKIMNEHFVCIKVDREERPDVDQVYMDAVQLMGQRGGWPLNCFTLPDGKPIFGGTYFTKDQWKEVLNNLIRVYEEEPEKVKGYAQDLTKGLRRQSSLIKRPVTDEWSDTVVVSMVDKWKTSFDNTEGGPNRAPKFPLPNGYQFLLRYGTLFGDSAVLDHVHLTLEKMAFGGIYDQIGGGFARYSTDGLWKVPHFEKMLYDNAQLISLYSEAYRATGKKLYKDIVYETVKFIERELTGKEGQFYSSLDADSEGEEGKFYVWTIPELKDILGENYKLAKAYYNVGGKGYWEEENHILVRDVRDAEIASKFDLTEEELRRKVGEIKDQLMVERARRVRPGLDDKTLTSWNALTVMGLFDAYQVFNDEDFYKLAIRDLKFLLDKQMAKDGRLNHSYKEGKSTINGYLEDYCYLIEALIMAYQSDFDEQWLDQAVALTDYAIAHFHDEGAGMFNFTSDLDSDLITRTREIQDNVIPASNSSMAKNLHLLGVVLDKKTYRQMAAQMLANVYQAMPTYGAGFSNWGMLALWLNKPLYQVAVTGNQCLSLKKEFFEKYVPNAIYMGAKNQSDIPLLREKFIDEQGTIFVCVDNICQLPVNTVIDAWKQIE